MKKQCAEHLRLILFLSFGFSLVLLFAALTSLVQAASPITGSGLNTQVSPPVPLPSGQTQYNITGGTRPGGASGTNLFHSFGDFNVPTNNIANFINTPINGSLPLTSNILARVTGTNGNNPTLSSIYGTIQTTGFGNANLFLMNPAGFLFGPNATVNVGGMVSFTSADYLRLADGVRFNAIPNATADALLSAAPVAAFGFLGSNPGAITVQGSQLTVTPGQSLSLVGGNITIQSGTLSDGTTVRPATLTAQGGQINLASVASPGEILAGSMNQVPNINGQSFGALGSIQVLEQSHIDASGNGGGTVLIRGGSFVLDNSTISANVTGTGPIIDGAEAIGGGIDIKVTQDAVMQNGAVLETNVVGNVNPATIYPGVNVMADSITIDGGNLPFFIFRGIRSDVGTFEQPTLTGGNGGSISLDANTILIKGGGSLETGIVGADPLTPVPGNAGHITLTAAHDLQLNDSTIGSSIFFGSGTAGNITLTSTHGNILETGNNLPPNFVPIPGQPIPSTRSNFITNQVVGGNTGNITLNAPEGEIRLAGAIIQLGIIDGTGSAGVFKANAKNMELINFSTIQMDNFSPQPARSFDLTITENLTLNNSRIITTARGPAKAADLNINSHDILVTGISSLSTETRSEGNAGHLAISAETLEVTNGGKITSGTAQNPPAPQFPGGPPPQTFPPPTGAGGTITVQGLAGSGSRVISVLIDGEGSGIFTNTVGIGAAGNTNISAQSLTVQNGGTISAATSGTAPSAAGGSITVNANQVQVNSGGVITASTTGAGVGGSVIINAAGTFSSDAGTVSTTAAQAVGGDLNINAGQSATLTNGASVSASSTGAGNAGNIQINAGNQLAMTNSSVTTEAHQASGGAIKITTNPNGTVQLIDSTISASVLDGTGGGGSVNIDPQYVVLQNSQILAQAVQGPGGNISITTNLLLPDSTSLISASSQFGQQGNIIIQSPISPASGKILPLGQKPLLATTLLSQRCAALAGGNASSFTVAGRDALPVEPGGWLSSPLALGDVELVGSAATEPETRTSLHGSTEEMPVVSLRRIAPAGFLTQTFPADRTTGCVS